MNKIFLFCFIFFFLLKKLIKTINTFDAMFIVQQRQINHINQLLNGLKPQVSGENPQNLFKEGKHSTFIPYLIAAIGAKGTQTEQPTLALGDWIEQTHLGNELEKSFDHEIKFLAATRRKVLPFVLCLQKY